MSNTKRATRAPRAIRLIVAWLPVLLYVGAIVAVSSLPANQLPSGSWWRHDKLIHAVEYAGLGMLLCRALRRGPPRLRTVYAALAAIACACACGVADELYQQLTPGRIPSVDDFVADAIGATLGVSAYVGQRAIRYWGWGRGRDRARQFPSESESEPEPAPEPKKRAAHGSDS